MGELPPKLFFRIGEVAGLVGVEPHVLRYWEREFRSIRPTKSAKGQRVYSRKDVENLIRVRELLYRDGFTIAGAKKKLQRPSDEPDAATEKETDGETTPGAVPVVKPAATGIAAVAPVMAVAPVTPPQAPRTRDKLLALRAEVEAFLEELTPRAR
jgi:DNA-binding transcriptional MerR regulator